MARHAPPPPPELASESCGLPSADDESGMHKLATKIQKFCALSLSKAVAMSKSLKGASDLLQSEADRYLIHHDMRAAIWTETSALSTLLQLPFTASEKHSMLHKWSQDKGGFMYQFMSIAPMRPALHDYISAKAIDNDTMVVVEGRETGYLDFCAKGKVLNFIQEWRCGVAIDNIIKVFLTDNMDDLADWAIKEIRTSLDGLRLDPGLGDALEACSVGMGGDMTKSVVDDLAKRIATFDPFISDCAGLADNLGIKASVVLQPFRDIQLAGYEISFNCKLVFDDEPVPLSDFVPLLERCAHIADLIAIASFIGAHLLAGKSKWIIPRSGHSRERASVPVLVAPHLACRDARCPSRHRSGMDATRRDHLRLREPLQDALPDRRDEQVRRAHQRQVACASEDLRI